MSDGLFFFINGSDDWKLSRRLVRSTESEVSVLGGQSPNGQLVILGIKKNNGKNWLQFHADITLQKQKVADHQRETDRLATYDV